MAGLLKCIALFGMCSVGVGCAPPDASGSENSNPTERGTDQPPLMLTVMDATQSGMACEIRIQAKNTSNAKSEELLLIATAMSTDDRISSDHQVAVSGLVPDASAGVSIPFDGVVCAEIAYIKVEPEAPLFINPDDYASQRILKLG